MKKFLLLALMAATIQFLQAQDFKKVETNYVIKRYNDAKTEIDKVMADPKAAGKADTWYWKSKVYAALYQDSALRVKYPNAYKDADEAFKKFQELDPTYALVKTKGTEGYFDMYRTSFENAIKLFNAKKYEEAAESFLLAVTYSDIIFPKKWVNTTAQFDTTSLLYLGYAYQNSHKYPEAVKQYTRLADYKVNGESYLDLYKFLVDYFTRNKNEEQFKKYMAISKELYPKESWEDFEMDFLDRNYNLTEKSSIYDKEDAAGTLSEQKYLLFGELFANVKNKEKELDSLTHVKYNLKAADAFKKAFAKNNQNSLAAYNVGLIYYIIFEEYDNKYAANIRNLQSVNANKPPADKDPKKRAAADAKFKEITDGIKKNNTEIEKPLLENVDYSIEWLEKSYSLLKGKKDKSKIEKSVINKSVDFLANLYGYKRDKARGKDPKAFDAYDAKYNEFDALHSKF